MTNPILQMFHLLDYRTGILVHPIYASRVVEKYRCPVLQRLLDRISRRSDNGTKRAARYTMFPGSHIKNTRKVVGQGLRRESKRGRTGAISRGFMTILLILYNTKWLAKLSKSLQGFPAAHGPWLGLL